MEKGVERRGRQRMVEIKKDREVWLIEKNKDRDRKRRRVEENEGENKS